MKNTFDKCLILYIQKIGQLAQPKATNHHYYILLAPYLLLSLLSTFNSSSSSVFSSLLLFCELWWLPWTTQVATCNSLQRTLTSTTAFCSGPSCRSGCGSHFPASSTHGCATILGDSFSTSSQGSCGASIFIIGRITFMSLKVNMQMLYPIIQLFFFSLNKKSKESETLLECIIAKIMQMVLDFWITVSNNFI